MISNEEAIYWLQNMKMGNLPCSGAVMKAVCNMAICALEEKQEEEWIPFAKELPPKGQHVHISTYGIVTIGERTSEAHKKLRLSILDPINNQYINTDPDPYRITHWSPLPKGYGYTSRKERNFLC